MTEMQIQVFIKVVETGSFSKAANVLYISQPAASKHISLLEEEFRFPLFERMHEGIRLTEAGKVMYRCYTDFFRSRNAALEEARHYGMSYSNHVRIGCLEGWTISGFFQPIRQLYKEKYPDTCLSIIGLNPGQIPAALQQGFVDIIITYNASLMKFIDLRTAVITQIGGGVLCASTHPLAQKPELCLEDFKDEIFNVVSEPGEEHFNIDYIRKLCAKHGFEPIIARSSSTSAVYTQIENSQGVHFTVDWNMARYNPLFRFVGVDCSFDICLCWTNDNYNDAKHVLINEISSYFDRKNTQLF